MHPLIRLGFVILIIFLPTIVSEALQWALLGLYDSPNQLNMCVRMSRTVNLGVGLCLILSLFHEYTFGYLYYAMWGTVLLVVTMLFIGFTSVPFTMAVLFTGINCIAYGVMDTWIQALTGLSFYDLFSAVLAD